MDKSLLCWWHKPIAIQGRFDRDAQIKEEIDKVNAEMRRIENLNRETVERAS